ncbi:MAG: ABC transporter permease, partial [Chloroflexi bacterium]|nr:ABC transporter permease [Chloroflexota bacterium]
PIPRPLHPPLTSHLHYESLFAPPGQPYYLGADNVGRDVLSRIIWGSRTSLYVGILSVLLGQIGGGFLGLISGYFGGKTDIVIQRVMDVLLSFPTLVLALAIVAALGPSENNVILAIGVTQSPRAARIIRSATLTVREAQYVDAARAIGCTDWRIVFQHVAPQTISPLIVLTSVELPHAILIEASLSFLGLGTPPPTPSWGGMLSGVGREFVQRAPWLAIYPGIAISLTVFGFNMLGDGLRDLLDPRLRR